MSASTAGTAAITVRRDALRLRPDPRRVLAKLFVPGQEGLVDGESRAGSVVDRVLGLTDEQVELTVADVLASFSARHADLPATLDEHFELVAHRIERPSALSTSRRLLVGAYFTKEYAIEAAAVCNPSMVAHPDQTGVAAGAVRIVMSLRAVGEGHLSCIEFRTGTVDADGLVVLDPPGNHLSSGRARPSQHDRDQFHRLLQHVDDDGSSAAFVLDRLPDTFTAGELDGALESLREQVVTRRGAIDTIERIRRIAESNYEVTFPARSALSERVLVPTAAAESHGMEDARFTRFTDDDGSVTYVGTYTAYDGAHVAPHLLRTTDFTTFTSSQLTGRGARDKGMALFPRRIGGRYVALSRSDRETNGIMSSDSLTRWDDVASLQQPVEPWELIQLGNCGPPIETPAGWLLLTHGVGPMRKYAIGAELLDLDDPSRVIGHLHQPLLVPDEDERDGYVPNVVYSCGSMLHGANLVLPYGMSDANIGIAVVALDELLEQLTAPRR